VKTEADIYAKAGKEYSLAFEKLMEEVKPPFCPPSFEVFRHEQSDRSKGWKRISATELANRLIRESAEKAA
jgi:hypothetical protein